MNKCDRHVSIIFCDDIRNELANKNSYMGMYGPQATVEELPGTFRMLNILVQLYAPESDPIRDFEVVVKHDDKELARFSPPIENGFKKNAVPIGFYVGEESVKEMLTVAATFTLGGLLYTQPGEIRVIVQADGEILPTPVLRLALGESSHATPPQ